MHMAEPMMTMEELKRLRGDRQAKICYLPVTEEISSKYLKEAKVRVDQILGAESVSPDRIAGRCFYIANGGDDTADGLSEDTPWKTTGRLQSAQADGTVQPGDGVFFRRGDVWDSVYATPTGGNCAMRMMSGVTYSAYGKGEKPLFRNCLNAVGGQNWEKTVYSNVWVYTGDAGDRRNDIGNIVVNNGEYYAIKATPADPNHPYDPCKLTVDCGMVTNKKEVFHSGGIPFTAPGCLVHNLEFFHNYEERKLYLYWDGGNPGECFWELLLVRRGNVVRSDEDSHDILIDNLAVKYGGSHGINLTECHNIRIQNCLFGWIGGSLQECDDNNTIQYGNAVENWGGCNGFTITDCVVFECYDAGLTTQAARKDPDWPVLMTEVDFSDNVIAYTNFAIELWCTNPAENPGPPYLNQMKNTRVNNNYCLYSGYHFGHQRSVKNGTFGNLAGKSPYQVFLNCQMRGNKFLYTSSFAQYSRSLLMGDSQKGFDLSNNIYIVGADKAYVRSCTEPENGQGEGRLYPYDEEALTTLASLGLEKDSIFYYYEGNLYPEEARGVYLYL